MVSTNGRQTRKKSSIETEVAFDFTIDPELLQQEYNQVRRPQLPYGIIVNDNPAGILIPVDQLEKAGWVTMPREEELTTVEYTESVTGLLITAPRLVVLGFVPEYIRYKADAEELAGSMVGLYDEYKSQLDKKLMEVCSEHAVVFLDSNNRPLHSIAIVVRFKNVALWSFKAAREEFYRQLEKTFADYCQVKYSGKTDKWRSLGVLAFKFKGVKEGEGKNKHFCCKTTEVIKPTKETFAQLFLGTPNLKEKIWNLHDEIAGFSESAVAVPALPSAIDPEMKILPSSKSQKLKKIEQLEETEIENTQGKDDNDININDDIDIDIDEEDDEDEDEDDEDTLDF